MNYRGRELDPIAFWERWVTFPTSTRADDEFLPLVQCPNPDHDTHKRHFQINAREPLVHCFARCGISGSWEHAICVIEGLYDQFRVSEADSDKERRRRTDRARRQARRIILKGASGTALRNSQNRRVQKSQRAVQAIHEKKLAYDSFIPALGLEYLESRGISSETVSTFELGWEPEERRIVIPAKDEDGRLRFLIRRAVRAKDHPKYLYTDGFPKTHVLFGACVLDLGLVKSSGLIVVEGSLDAIMLHQHGFRNTVAILGTGISEEQKRIVARLRPPKVFLFFDKDTAGVRNIEIAMKELRKYPLYIVKFPKHRSDPAEMSREEVERQVGRAVPLFKFQRSLRARRGISIG